MRPTHNIMLCLYVFIHLPSFPENHLEESLLSKALLVQFFLSFILLMAGTIIVWWFVNNIFLLFHLLHIVFHWLWRHLSCKPWLFYIFPKDLRNSTTFPIWTSYLVNNIVTRVLLKVHEVIHVVVAKDLNYFIVFFRAWLRIICDAKVWRTLLHFWFPWRIPHWNLTVKQESFRPGSKARKYHLWKIPQA